MSHDKAAIERTARTYEPASDIAKRYQGWGTALKPGHEPIILARKPFPGTVAANVQEHGTGALNIDATRIGTDKMGGYEVRSSLGRATHEGGAHQDFTAKEATGRWPANVILDEDQAAALDEQSGNRPGFSSQTDRVHQAGGQSGDWGSIGKTKPGRREGYNDQGGASRFFYVAKAGKKERPSYVDENGKTVAHPTVKPLTLIEHLVKLITPPGGVVLDMFAGSGTTGEAAVNTGHDVILVENKPEYVPLIQQRIDRATEQKGSTLL